MKLSRRLVQMVVVMPLCFAMLTGCMYPNELRKENKVPGEYIAVVQQAVDRYQEANSVPPIRNSEMDTPIYEKYVIDFKKLLDSGYLSHIPNDAFENGGNYYYVLVDVEEQPKVKLMDLVAKQQVGDLQREVEAYRLKHDALPLGEQVADSIYRLSYDLLGIKPVQVRSPYSRQYLSLLINETGSLYIDYAPDIMLAKEKVNETVTEGSEVDLRTWLVDQSYFVPVNSLPYYWVNEQPQAKAD
jgi:hypothetical protein